MLRLALLLAAAPATAQEAPTWAQVGPLLAARCVVCHSGPEAPLGLRLDAYATAVEGSRNGPVLRPGDPEGSELVRRIRGLSFPAMPLVGPALTPEEKDLIEAWIVAGLPEGEAQAAPPEPAVAALPGEGEPVTFAHVEPILLQRCAKCHSDARAEGPPEGLRLDTYEHVLEGGERLAVVPENPEASEVVRRIEGTAQPRMPHDGPPWLSDEQVDLIRRWIDGGAPDAEGTPAPMPVGREVRYRGLMTGEAEIDGIPFLLDGGTRIDDRPAVGQEGEVRGTVAEGGAIRATRLRDR